MQGRLQFSPRAFLIFVVFLVAFGLLIALDTGSGMVSRLWAPLFWSFIALATLAVYLRMWRVRGSPGEIWKVQAQGLYGALPRRLQNWFFP